ncbi:calsequestrin-2-like [Cynara cardunculus var. scolymus]|uniref:calsequestrin-2-like n=1 Tax=Cynara cardunculus var. scolymus TaxID=59895 RepID=UPI000D623575|nr:calsequestrin-2-like [Cynara cardunculus var. scolymus]
MSAKKVNFSIDEMSFKPNNRVALLDIPANKSDDEEVATFLKNSLISFAISHKPVMVKEILQQLWLTVEVVQETDKTGMTSSDLSVVKADVNDVKEWLSVVQADVCTTVEDISALNSKANEVNVQLTKHVEVVDDAINSHEAEAEVVDDVVRADAEAHDEDLHITFATDAGDEEDEGEDDDEDHDDSPCLPDFGKDLDGEDDEDDDDDDFTIQYNKPSSALNEVSRRDSSSHGEK